MGIKKHRIFFANSLQTWTTLGRNFFANCLPTLFLGVYGHGHRDWNHNRRSTYRHTGAMYCLPKTCLRRGAYNSANTYLCYLWINSLRNCCNVLAIKWETHVTTKREKVKRNIQRRLPRAQLHKGLPHYSTASETLTGSTSVSIIILCQLFPNLCYAKP
jgi:hypothetical protein